MSIRESTVGNHPRSATLATQGAHETGSECFMNEVVVDLAERHSNDLDVILWWDRGSGRLWVCATDRLTDRTDLIGASAENALEVFNHPFAYRAEAA
jgi:hypothetical protein